MRSPAAGRTEIAALHESLAAVGRFLPRDVHVELSLSGEVNASETLAIGGTPTLVGYRLTAGPAGERDVLASTSQQWETEIELLLQQPLVHPRVL